MAKTRAELIAEVADILGVTGVGETLSAEDRSKIDGKIDPKIAELARREIIYIASADAIDDEAFDALATLVAEQCAPGFGQPRNKDIRTEAEDRLREMEPGSWGDDDTVEATYF